MDGRPPLGRMPLPARLENPRPAVAAPWIAATSSDGVRGDALRSLDRCPLREIHAPRRVELPSVGGELL